MHPLPDDNSRIRSIDIVRGIVMVLMVLDHVRDLFHENALTSDPTDLQTTTTAIFLTRWITHLCAPAFVFLSGVSAYLSFRKQNNPGLSRNFFITRGFWLILLEFTVVNFGLWFDPGFGLFLFQVIAAIGLGLIVLGVSARANPTTIGLAGLAILVLHPAFQILPLEQDSLLKTVLNPLFLPGVLELPLGKTLIVGYPPIPWIGIMLAGYGLGYQFLQPLHRRINIFLRTGVVALLIFTMLRFLNNYGDPVQWSGQKNGWFTFLSFINVSKYPPSPLFSLVTLGLMFLVLSVTEKFRLRIFEKLSVFGKVPLFFYLIHWYLIHPLLFLMILSQGYSFSEFEFGFNFGRPTGSNGLNLWMVYLIWAGTVVLLYPVCRWYWVVKKSSRFKKWLRYV